MLQTGLGLNVVTLNGRALDHGVTVGGKTLLDFCVEQAGLIFGAEHLDPAKHGSNWRMEYVFLVPHVRGVVMVREMKTKKRFAKLRGVLHLGGFRRMNQGNIDEQGNGESDAAA
jgi:hypothetical protein